MTHQVVGSTWGTHLRKTTTSIVNFGELVSHANEFVLHANESHDNILLRKENFPTAFFTHSLPNSSFIHALTDDTRIHLPLNSSFSFLVSLPAPLNTITGCNFGPSALAAKLNDTHFLVSACF